jgi:hypothetical protein
MFTSYLGLGLGARAQPLKLNYGFQSRITKPANNATMKSAQWRRMVGVSSGNSLFMSNLDFARKRTPCRPSPFRGLTKSRGNYEPKLDGSLHHRNYGIRASDERGMGYLGTRVATHRRSEGSE